VVPYPQELTMIFVISGPSGSGKSTLVHHVLEREDGVEFSVSHTTRAPRKGEETGRDYHFVSEERFREMIAADDFAEYAEVHGNYYGTSLEEVQKKGADGDVLLDIDVQGAGQIRRSMPEAVLVLVLPPSYEKLRERLEKRGLDSSDVISRRLVNARREIQQYSLFDFTIINDQIEEAVADLRAVIRCQHCRTPRRMDDLEKIIATFDTEI